MTATLENLMLGTRAKLVMRSHFFGFPSMQLRLKETRQVRTMATDGVYLFYNPDYVQRIKDDTRETMVAHETIHCMLHHVFRRMGRDPDLWNRACDYVVNGMLKAAGFTLWPGALVDARFDDLSAELVYDILLQEQRQAQQQQQQQQQDEEDGDNEQTDEGDDDGDEEVQDDDGGDEDGTDGEVPPSADDLSDDADQEDEGEADEDGGEAGDDSDASGEADDRPGEGEGDGEPETLQPDDLMDCPGRISEDADGEKLVESAGDVADSWSVAVVQAAHMAELAGEQTGGMDRVVELNQRAYVDWKSVLREWIAQTIPTDQRWFPPNRRYLWRNIYMPSLLKAPRPELLVVIDSSMSTWRVVPTFVAELNQIMDEMHTLIHVVTCDQQVYEVGTFDDEPIGEINCRGGGGTSFIPPFAWAAEHTPSIDGLIYMTDGYGAFPVSSHFNTLWVMSTDVKPPWGDHLRIPLYSR